MWEWSEDADGKTVIGTRLAAGQTFGESKAWKWSRDADAKTVAYVSADLTGVGMQGENATKADGRMAAVGMVFNAGVPGQARYVCGMTDGLKGLSAPVRHQGAQVGLDKAGNASCEKLATCCRTGYGGAMILRKVTLPSRFDGNSLSRRTGSEVATDHDRREARTRSAASWRAQGRIQKRVTVINER